MSERATNVKGRSTSVLDGLAPQSLICANCGKKFIARRAGNIYCRNPCRRASRRAGGMGYKQRSSIRPCPKCGTAEAVFAQPNSTTCRDCARSPFPVKSSDVDILFYETDEGVLLFDIYPVGSRSPLIHRGRDLVGMHVAVNWQDSVVDVARRSGFQVCNAWRMYPGGRYTVLIGVLP